MGQHGYQLPFEFMGPDARGMMLRLFHFLENKYKLLVNFFNDFILAFVTTMPGETGIRLRHRYYSRRGAQLAKNVKLHEGVTIECAQNCILDQGATLFAGTTLAIGNGGSFKMGKRSHIGAQCYVLVGDGSVEIGNGTAIGPHTQLIACSNSFSGNSPIAGRAESGVIKIGDDVLLGAGVVVLPDITISSHCVVGAGAVVTGNLAEWTISVGAPARTIKSRFG